MPVYWHQTSSRISRPTQRLWKSWYSRAKRNWASLAVLFSTPCSTVCSEGCTKNKSHPKVTFKWSRVFDGLLPALSGVVKLIVWRCKDTNKRANYKINSHLFLVSSESIFEIYLKDRHFFVILQIIFLNTAVCLRWNEYWISCTLFLCEDTKNLWISVLFWEKNV